MNTIQGLLASQASVETLSGAPAVVAERSDRIDQVVAALARAQARFHAVKRNAANPFYNSRYADLAAVMDVVRGPIADEGLALWQTFEHDPARPDWITTVTTLAHGPSGQWISNRIPMRALPKRRKRRPGDEGGEEELIMPGGALSAQDLASGAQYGRRYGAMALLGIVAEGEDDDGNRASGKRTQESKWDTYLAARPDVAEALRVDHPTIADIAQRAPRFGKLTDAQEGLVLQLAREHGGQRGAVVAGVARGPAPAGAGRGSDGPLGPEPPVSAEAFMPDAWQLDPTQEAALVRLLDECQIRHHRLTPDAARHVVLPPKLARDAGVPSTFAMASLNREGCRRLYDALMQLRATKQQGPGTAGGGQPLPAAAKTSPGDAVVHPHQDGAAAGRSGSSAASAVTGPQSKPSHG
jgi:hypothetical protein